MARFYFFLFNGFQVRDILRSLAQDIEGSIRQQVQALCSDRFSSVGLFEYFDDISAQSTGAPSPVRVN